MQYTLLYRKVLVSKPDREVERETQREIENKTGIDCREREIERDREKQTQTDKKTDTH